MLPYSTKAEEAGNAAAQTCRSRQCSWGHAVESRPSESDSDMDRLEETEGGSAVILDILFLYIYMSPMFKEYLFTRYQTWHLLSHFFATTTATCVASYRMILLVDGDLERSKSL